MTIENGYLPYPAGPARNPTSIQRGSAIYLSTYPGDPTTPRCPAYHNATRLEAGNIPTIPSIPLSWANAKALFEQEFGGIEEGRKLDGKLGTHLVKLTNDGKCSDELVLICIQHHSPSVDTKMISIWNTMAAIPGRIKDEVVILGCHRDGESITFDKCLLAQIAIKPGLWVVVIQSRVLSLYWRLFVDLAHY